MNIRSAKNKGRRLASELREALLQWAPDLSERDIQITSASVPGPDLYLSPAAEDVYPIVWECKNQEKISIWQAIEQSQGYADREGVFPVLCFSRNRAEPMVALRLEDFLRLIR